MLQLQKTLRCNTSALSRAATAITSRLYCKDYSSSDDEKPPKKKPVKVKAENENKNAGEESAASRLNRLLASMKTEDNLNMTRKTANMAKPGEGGKKRKEAAKKEADSKDIVAAAKNVAAMLGGSSEEAKKQTESELLAKLLGHKFEDETPAQGGSQDSSKPLEEMSLSEIIVGMKIDRNAQPKSESRGEFVKRTLLSRSQQKQSSGQSTYENRYKSKRPQRTQPVPFSGSVDLFGGERLNIFKDVDSLKPSEDILETWAHLQQRELELQIARPPANYFEKIAQWTEQGKVWRFPIDNEQDWTEEVNVDFTEHVFLDQHLESWCPSRGPIRHFMELVCVGLSKNPYITAAEKKEHILWYRDYFMAKKEILKDLMDEKKMQQSTLSSETATKQIESPST